MKKKLSRFKNFFHLKERHDRLPDVLRLEGGEMPHRAHHRNRDQRLLPGRHPERSHLARNPRLADAWLTSHKDCSNLKKTVHTLKCFAFPRVPELITSTCIKVAIRPPKFIFVYSISSS